MMLLIKLSTFSGMAAHIPNQVGAPLCKTRVKLGEWKLRDYDPIGIAVCAHCQKLQEEKRAEAA